MKSRHTTRQILFSPVRVIFFGAGTEMSWKEITIPYDVWRHLDETLRVLTDEGVLASSESATVMHSDFCWPEDNRAPCALCMESTRWATHTLGECAHCSACASCVTQWRKVCDEVGNAFHCPICRLPIATVRIVGIRQVDSEHKKQRARRPFANN